MKRSSRSDAMNFWPGYVDAMTNVVLNLMFMVAMFGIALAVFNATPRSTELGKSDTGAQPTEPGDQMVGPVINGTAGSPMTGDAGKGLVRRSSMPAGSTSSPDGASDGIVVPSTTALPTRQPPLGRSAPSRDGVPAGTLAAGARTTGARADLGTYGNEAARQRLLVDQPVILVADAFQRRGGPKVAVTRRLDPTGGALVVVDVPRGTEPFAAMNRPDVSRLLREGVAEAAGPLLVWTSADLDDPTERRAAFLALTATRNALITAGRQPDSITTKLLQGRAGTPDAMQLFIQPISPGSNGEPSQPAAAATAMKPEDVL